MTTTASKIYSALASIFATFLFSCTTFAAGNVAVEVVDGELTLTGDFYGNQILIERSVLNRYRVSGLEGTKVNGKAMEVFTVSKGIRAELLGGDDLLQIEGKGLSAKSHDVQGRLVVRMGTGADIVKLNHFQTHFPVNIATEGNGDDTVRLTNVSIGSRLHIVTGTGDDNVEFNAVAARDLVMYLGEENDVFVDEGGAR